MRRESWQDFAVPRGIGDAFQKSGTAIAIATIIGFGALFYAANALRPESGEGFYAVMSHSVMIAIFLPGAFLKFRMTSLSVW